MATAGYISVDDYIPEILQYAHGAPSILVRVHLRNAVIDFCQRTLILKRDPSGFFLEEDEHTYLMHFCQDRYVAVGTETVFLEDENATDGNEEKFIETTSRELDSEYHNWRNMVAPTPSRYFLTEEINKIRFFPRPTKDSTKEVIIRGIVRPRRDQTEFDEFLFEKWHEVIQNGALASILLIRGASWFEPKLAAAFRLDYNRGVRNARKVALSGTGTVPGRVIPQSYNVVGSNNTRRAGTWV